MLLSLIHLQMPGCRQKPQQTRLPPPASMGDGDPGCLPVTVHVLRLCLGPCRQRLRRPSWKLGPHQTKSRRMTRMRRPLTSQLPLWEPSALLLPPSCGLRAGRARQSRRVM